MPVTPKTIVTKERLGYYHNKLKVLLDAKGEVKGISIDGTTYSPDSSGIITLPENIASLIWTDEYMGLASTHYDTNNESLTDRLMFDFRYQNDATNPRIVLNSHEYNNDTSSFVRQTSVNLPTKEYVDSVVSNLDSLRFEKVTTLPTTGENGIIYLVPNSGAGQNVYDEYVWVNVGTETTPDYKYELIGTTAVDLDGYLQETDLVEITNAEIDEMFA